MIETSKQAAVFRFRVALVVVLAIPWLAGAVLIPVFGWHPNVGAARVVGYVVLTLIPAVFAWRKPGRTATWWLVGVIAVGALGALIVGHSVAAVVLAVSFDVLAIALLVTFALPIRRRTS